MVWAFQSGLSPQMEVGAAVHGENGRPPVGLGASVYVVAAGVLVAVLHVAGIREGIVILAVTGKIWVYPAVP